MIEKIKRYLIPEPTPDTKRMFCLPCHRITEQFYERGYDEEKEREYDKYTCMICGIVYTYYEG